MTRGNQRLGIEAGPPHLDAHGGRRSRIRRGKRGDLERERTQIRNAGQNARAAREVLQGSRWWDLYLQAGPNRENVKMAPSPRVSAREHAEAAARPRDDQTPCAMRATNTQPERRIVKPLNSAR